MPTSTTQPRLPVVVATCGRSELIVALLHAPVDRPEQLEEGFLRYAARIGKGHVPRDAGFPVGGA